MESSNVSVDKLDKFFEARFHFVRRAQKITGLWPYDTPISLTIRRIVSSLTLFFYAAPMIRGIITFYGKDQRDFVECIIGATFCFGVMIKFCHVTLIQSKIEGIYNGMANTWLSAQSSGEYKILEQYAQQGKLICFFYTGYVIVAAAVFHAVPIVMNMYYSVIGSNITRDQLLLIRGDYFVDIKTYFYLINIYTDILAVISVNIILSIDLSFIIIIHHCLAIFRVVKLKELNEIRNDIDISVQLKRAIKAHQYVLQVVDDIQEAFSLLFLVLVGLSILIISFGAVWMLSAIEFREFLKYLLVIIGLIIHLFTLSWPGQQVMDHSTDIFEGSYECNWYRITKQNKNLIRFMMMRSLKPSVLTAKGLYIMNYENFATILKTTASYITVIKSVTFEE